MAVFDKFTDFISIVAEKVDDNKYLAAIKGTFTIYLPFIIVGSFATLGNSLLASETTGLAQFSGLAFLSSLGPAFTAINFATMNIMTLAIVFILAMQLAQKNGENEIFSGLVALSAYIAVVPQGIMSVVDGVESLVSGVPVTAMNASGLFVGMILTVFVVELFCFLCKVEKLKIKMPPTVPGAISKSFNTLVPIFITLTTFGILGRLFTIATGSYINDFIYEILQAPMEVFFQSPIGIIGIVIISQLFWLVGIHGGLVISPIRNPILIAALAANIAAYEGGHLPDQIITMGSWLAFIVVGGAGLILSLIIAIFIASKKEEDRAMAKLGFVPALFGISEPIVFGLPLVLNPLFAIPFVFGSGVAAAILLVAGNIGFLTPNIIDVPFGIPIFISGFIGWGFSGIIVQAIIVAIGTLLYLPFVLLSNKQAIPDEDNQENFA